MTRHITSIFRVTLLVLLAGSWCWGQTYTRSSVRRTSAQTLTRSRQLPAGTAIRMSLEETISGRSRYARTFSGMVTDPILLDGRTIVPAGANISGRIVSVTNPRHIAGRPSMDLRPEQLALPSGEKLRLSASVVDTGRPDQFDVDDEGRIHVRHTKASYSKRETLIGTGAGAGLGAALGGISGAIVGASVGTGAATTHWLLKRRYGQIPAGTVLILELTRPLVIDQKTEVAGGWQ
jgi:hypothetical protein